MQTVVPAMFMARGLEVRLLLFTWSVLWTTFCFSFLHGCALPDVACGHRLSDSLSDSACILLRRFASRDDIGWIVKEV